MFSSRTIKEEQLQQEMITRANKHESYEGIAKRLLERIDVMEDSVRLTLRSGGSTRIVG